MIVGSTVPSISKTEVFSQISEIDVLCAVFPEIKSLPYKMCSPLRVDRHPSFGIYANSKGNVYYRDYATQEKGNLLDLLCKYWDCTFPQTLAKICDIAISKKDITFKPKQIKIFTRKNKSDFSKLQVAIRPWRDYDYGYWESYGISKSWLKYAEIYPISYKIITKRESLSDKENKYVFSADKYAYCFVERKEGNLQLKVYQPFNTKGYKWCSNMDSSVVGLWSKIPEYGEKVVICSSLKDALCLACQCHIPTLCLQGEGYGISQTAVNELKRRYKKIFICFDGDEVGRKNAEKLAKRTGFTNVVCPILDTPAVNNSSVERQLKRGLIKSNKAKDISDIFLYFGKERFMQEFANAFLLDIS